MMPSTIQGRAQMRRLRVYPGDKHRHEAQVSAHPAAS
jgi:ribosomal protein L13